MGFFTPKPTVEARLEKAEGDLAAANDQLASLRSELSASQLSVTNLQSERDTAIAERDGLQSRLDSTSGALDSLGEQLRSSLQLTEEQMTALGNGDLAIVSTAITALAERRTVEVAAAQGVPPVITSPSASNAAEDEIAIAYQTASAEKDPRKRGALFARATRLVMNKKAHSNN